MSSTATSTRPAERLAFQPHRRWYRRADILVPVVVVTFAFALLVVADPGQQNYSSRFSAEGATRFDWDYFWHLVPQMLTGLYITGRGVVLAFTIAIVGGFVLALGRRAQLRVIHWPVAAIIEFIRSTPLLVQLFFVQALSRATDVLSLSSVEILVLTLGVHYATYCSEAYRAGINSVPQGQWEASTALNLAPLTKWTNVIIPQAVPNVLPALGNYLVAAFKDAPMAFIVGVTDILFFANTIQNVDFRTVEPFLLVGVGFLLASVTAAWAVRRLEKRIEYQRI